MIFLSAGHHPSAPGARCHKFIEHDEAVVWVKRIAELLKDRCVVVPNVPLKDKVAFINARCDGNDLLCEVHFNDATKWVDKNKDGVQQDDEHMHVGTGTETLYCPGSQKGIVAATIVESALNDIFPFKWVDRNGDGTRQPDELEGRGIKEGWYRMDPKRGPDFILDRTKCVAIITEPEFVQHADRIIANRERACLVLADALIAAEEAIA